MSYHTNLLMTKHASGWQTEYLSSRFDQLCTDEQREIAGRFRTGLPTMSFVYFIASETEKIKIGVTANNPGQRLKALQSSSPGPLKLLYAVGGNCHHEEILHLIFGPQWQHGEWFIFDEAFAEFLVNLKTVGLEYATAKYVTRVEFLERWASHDEFLRHVCERLRCRHSFDLCKWGREPKVGTNERRQVDAMLRGARMD